MKFGLQTGPRNYQELAMTTDLTDQEKSLIREKVREKYAQASVSPAGCFGYPTGVAGIRQLGYQDDTTEVRRNRTLPQSTPTLLRTPLG